MLYFYGLKLGFQSLFWGRLSKKTAALLVMPVNYWRVAEYRLAHNALNPRGTDVILDIGSPKLFSLFLAEKYGVEIYPTDIEDYFLEEYEFHRSLLPKHSADKIHCSVQDGRNLTMQDSMFDKVYSISVIEHIPDMGDSTCLQEIYRVLKPGGRCVLTIPFAPTGRDEFRDGNFYWAGSSKQDSSNRVFFQRRYSEQDIHDRLITPSQMKLVSLEYVGERILTKSNKELATYLPYVLGPLHPMMAHLFLTKPAADWRSLKKPLCAVVILEKP